MQGQSNAVRGAAMEARRAAMRSNGPAQQRDEMQKAKK